MFNLQEYISFTTLFNENNELNKEYAEEKGIRVSVYKDKALIRYDKTRLNKLNIETLGLFRSVIYDIINKKIISFSPPKSHDYQDFSEHNNYDDCVPLQFIEGTMINIFWDPTTKKTEISTKSNIGANCYFHVGKNKLSFREMYKEAAKDVIKDLHSYKNLDIDGFDKEKFFSEPKENYCYSMILQHKKNRIVTNITKNNLYLIGIYKIRDDFIIEPRLEELRTYYEECSMYSTPFYSKVVDDNHSSLFKSPSFDSIKDNYHNKNLDYSNMGLVLYSTKTGFHTKIRNQNYEYVRRLKGNNIKPQYRYHELRKEGKLDEFLNYFPEYTTIFTCYRDDMYDMITQLYSYYVACFIKHEMTLKDAPYQFKPHIYNLHGIYLNDLRNKNEYITKKTVNQYVNNLEIPKVMYFTNYNLKNNNGVFEKMKYDNQEKTIFKNQVSQSC